MLNLAGQLSPYDYEADLLCCSDSQYQTLRQTSTSLWEQAENVGGWKKLWQNLSLGMSFLRFRTLALALPVGCDVCFRAATTFQGLLVEDADGKRLQGSFEDDLGDGPDGDRFRSTALSRLAKQCLDCRPMCYSHAVFCHLQLDDPFTTLSTLCDPGEIAEALRWDPSM